MAVGVDRLTAGHHGVLRAAQSRLTKAGAVNGDIGFSQDHTVCHVLVLAGICPAGSSISHELRHPVPHLSVATLAGSQFDPVAIFAIARLPDRSLLPPFPLALPDRRATAGRDAREDLSV
ncbi:MAG: hypothetical protein ACKO9B_17200 [Planctomycetota bacterium]